MKTNIFYYSSTGNSLYVSKRIGEKILDSELIQMADRLKEKSFEYECENAIFVYPVHCFGLPIVAFDFIKNLKLKNCKYVYCIAVSGGGSGKGSFVQINKLLGESKEVDDCITIKYVSNYIKAGRNADEERVEKCDKENEVVIDKVIDDILNKTKCENKIKKSSGPLSHKAWMKYFRGKNNKFTVNDDCIGCEICMKVCPVSNISMENQKPVWAKSCVDCMGCINLCPKKAINLGNKTIKKNRYKNKNIKASELYIK